MIANIEEGFARPTTAEYLTFLGYSEASLVEVKGDIQRTRQDNILPTILGSSLSSIGISLALWHERLKESVISKPPGKILQSPLNPLKGIYRNLEDSNKTLFNFGYPPVDALRAESLTYEIFIELINKTSWHLRRLVTSLEDKLNRDQKYYQVEKARVRSNLKFR